MQQNEVKARLQAGPCVLDGATGTELERRGIPTGLPLWSAAALWEHPRALFEIHADYARAGVDFLTANTFRTQHRTLERAGRGDQAGCLTAEALRLAIEGAGTATRVPLVLGSAPPLEDCYRPRDVPAEDALVREHRMHAENLARAGADAILIETMNCIRESVAAVDAARAVGLPFLVSFVCWDGATLLSGEPLEAAIEAVSGSDPCAIAVNCLPPSNTTSCVEVLAASGLPFGIYANLGEPDDDVGFERSEDCTAEAFAAHAEEWISAGASLVGGCCGTTPDHIREVVRRIRA
jgi:S-methylmethionine-dependent homocysteine/selenocysteine methylase